MVRCSVSKCHSQTGEQKKVKISFHKFPRNELREKWIKAVKRENWKPSSASVLCSLHFEESCFDRSYINTTKLRRDAIPTIFSPYLLHFQQEVHVGTKREIDKVYVKTEPLVDVVGNMKIESTDLEDNIVETKTTRQQTESSLLNFKNRLPSGPLIKTEPVHLEMSYMKLSPLPVSPTAEEDPLPPKEMVSRATSVSPQHRHRPESPRIINRSFMKQKIEKYQKRVRILQQRERQQAKKIAFLQKTIETLRKQMYSYEEC